MTTRWYESYKIVLSVSVYWLMEKNLEAVSVVWRWCLVGSHCYISLQGYSPRSSRLSSQSALEEERVYYGTDVLGISSGDMVYGNY